MIGEETSQITYKSAAAILSACVRNQISYFFFFFKLLLCHIFNSCRFHQKQKLMALTRSFYFPLSMDCFYFNRFHIPVSPSLPCTWSCLSPGSLLLSFYLCFCNFTQDSIVQNIWISSNLCSRRSCRNY